MALAESGHVPSSTYRVQLHKEFNFAELGRLAPYFRDLGVSDLYLSPIFKSVPGSQHGYDVTDFSEVNPELGGSKEFGNVAALYRSLGCSFIVDFVPNHMGIEGALNRRWRGVLEYGPLSRHASFFDIQWKSEPTKDHPRVLVPLLGDQYGKVLEKGDIRLVYENGFFLRYDQSSLPVRPESYPSVLGPLTDSPDAGDLGRIIADLAGLSADAAASRPPSSFDMEQQAQGLKERLDSLMAASPQLKERLAARLAELNGKPGDAQSFDALHGLIEMQHYRLARWQFGAHEINYRRFFAIDTLVGLHMENADVFRECHALLSRLLANGTVCGLRIDHIDGLRQPETYLRRLQSLDRAEKDRPLYVLVEKILAQGEALPGSWPVHGTTGYEFISDLAGILTDGAQTSRLDGIYRRFTGETVSYEAMVTRCKRLIIAEMFANAVSNLGMELVSIVEDDRDWRDLTRHELTTAVSELAAHLGVYRTYRRGLEPLGDQDRAVMSQACTRAVADNPRADPQALEFVRDLVIGVYPPPGAPAEYKNRVQAWVLTFQQYTGAIMAKSVEDTAFYNYNRLVALNEVGCNPGTVGGSAEAFHRSNEDRQRTNPLSLLTTSTHDSKFSEDVRARLYVISELGSEWEAWVAEWSRLAERHVSTIDGGPAPDALDQYRFFQVLLGAWPLDEREVDPSFVARLREHLRKCVDEAKRHTSIMNKNDAYLSACDRFVDGLTSAAAGRDFLDAFRPCAARIARLGMVNSLAQVVIKCTVPGVPDFYQGNEVWNFSLVDPDNRRPVDFGSRTAALGTVADAPLSALLDEWHSGGIKLRVTRGLLRLRRELPDLFARGSYSPVAAGGSFAGHVVSYTRTHEGQVVLVVVPRLTAAIGCPPIGHCWDDTSLEGVPDAVSWTDVLTGGTFEGNPRMFLRSLFAELPFAVLRGASRPSHP